MKSKEERKAAQAANNAKFKARMAEINEKSAMRKAEIDATYAASKAEAQANVAKDDQGRPLPYLPSTTAALLGGLVPGLSIVQAAKAFSSHKKYLASLSPEERAEYVRRNPGGYGGS